MRSFIASTVFVVASIVAVPAFAHESAENFPMPAAAYKAKIDAHTVKAREHMEKRAAKLNADEAKALRAKFDAGTVQIDQAVAKATADGTVTAEEAKQVREVAKTARPHGGRHHNKQ